MGSSRISTRASDSSARAISTICCCATLERRDAHARIDRQIEFGEPALSSVDHFAARQPRAAALAAEKDVVGDAQLGNEREFLIDEADTRAGESRADRPAAEARCGA